MQSKREKEVIQKGIDETTAYYQNKYEESKRKHKKPVDPARPSLIKRFGGILVDTAFIAAVAFGMQTLMYNTLYYPMGYHEDKEIIGTMNTESHLFVEGETGGLIQISEGYDSSKTPEENYDVPITYFYSTNDRAIEAGKLEAYNTSKANSYLFDYDSANDKYVRSSSATDSTIKSFLKTHYEEALSFYKSNPEYIQHSNHSLFVVVMTLFINSAVTSGIFYLAIPMIDKKRRTLGMMITKTFLSDMDKKPATRMQTAVRYGAILFMNFIVPIGIYLLYPELIAIVWFMNAGIICFTPTFDSLHGLLSKTKVINVTLSSPMESYKQIQDMIDQEKQMNPDAFKKDNE